MSARRHPVQPMFRPLRRTVRLAALALVAAGVLPLLAGEPIKRYPQITLKDGRQLAEVEVVNYTMTDVLVRHTGGATMLRSDLLPTEVAADLHLPANLPASAPLPDFSSPAFLALANKVAVAEAQPAAAVVAAPTSAATITAVTAPAASAPAEPATAAPAESAAPAGEGNYTEAIPLLSAKAVLAETSAPKSAHVDLPGRVAVALPTGEQVLPGGVEVRAYPAGLLNGYLEKAAARANEAAEKLVVAAAAAAAEGRLADAEALTTRARRTADQFLDYLPVAPYATQSDAHGHFTLSHDLREVRLVASARVTTAAGEWTFRWIGLAVDKDALLTDANATTVVAPEPARPRFAAR